MGYRFERLVYATLLLLLFSAAALAQPYRRLTVSDFRGTPQPGQHGEIAFTNCTIEYSYIPHRQNGYYLLDFNIKLVMNSDQSWLDRKRITTAAMMAEILKHEQGHYNLAYLEQQELLRTVKHTVFRENFREVANAIFDRIEAKYHMLNDNYDTDTQNSMNRTQQHSWDLYFDRQLTAILGASNYYAVARQAPGDGVLPSDR